MSTCFHLSSVVTAIAAIYRQTESGEYLWWTGRQFGCFKYSHSIVMAGHLLFGTLAAAVLAVSTLAFTVEVLDVEGRVSCGS